MRIVQVIPDFGLGGIQKGGIVLANAMSRRGHEVHVVSPTGGPRYLPGGGSGPQHHLLGEATPEAMVKLLKQLGPDVVHMHRNAFPEPLVRSVLEQVDKLVVMTPVFGRPPADRGLLQRCKTCLVGIYAFHRFTRWLNLGVDEAIARGIGYVPITPFEPPTTPYSALDAPDLVRQRRRELGVPEGATAVFGRIGRQHFSKWHPSTVQLIDKLLREIPSACWVSVGLPAEFDPPGLRSRWGERFLHFDETPDFDRLAQVLSSFDAQLMFGRGECFASTICEAAGVAVPSIALATPLKDNGQAEQVIDGVTGYLVGSVEQAVARARELTTAPEALAQLKQRTREYSNQHWLADISGDHLLELYEFWSGKRSDAPYTQTMRTEAESFRANYRERMVNLMASSAPDRALWRARLAAVESWSVFRVGRLAKRMMSPSSARQLSSAESQWY